MPTENDLRTSFKKRLKEHAVLSEFFGEMLAIRIQRPHWLENALVQLILRDNEERIDCIARLVQQVCGDNGTLQTELSHKLNGKEGDFDLQLGDLLAELNAVRWLKKERYERISTIEISNKKTPDLEAYMHNKRYLFEVKNLRAPSELLHYLFLQIEVRSLLRPDAYASAFQVDVSSVAGNSDEISDNDRLNVQRFIMQVEDRMREKQNAANLQYSNAGEGKGSTTKLACKWGRGGKFFVMGPMGGVGKGNLIPLLLKTWRVTLGATVQLMSYDSEDACAKHILLNWQRPMGYFVDDELSGRYRGSVEAMNPVIQQVNNKLHVTVL